MHKNRYVVNTFISEMFKAYILDLDHFLPTLIHWAKIQRSK